MNGPTTSLAHKTNDPPLFTWVKDYEITLSTHASFFPESLPATLAPHPTTPTTPLPAPHTPLVKLWTITRRGSGGAGDKTTAGLAGLPTASSSTPFLLVDAALGQDPDVCALLLHGLTGHPATQGDDQPGVEHVGWVDNLGYDLLPSTSHGLPRPLVHRLNVLHKGAGIFVRDGQGRVFVHQRAAHKRIFPSMHDMFVGGVSLFGEGTGATARRELFEELGLGGGKEEKEEKEGGFEFMFSVLIETGYNRCFVDVYVSTAGEEEAEKVVLDQEEVQWGEWVSLEEVKRRVALDGQPGEWTFVPDGLLVWNALVAHWEGKG